LRTMIPDRKRSGGFGYDGANGSRSIELPSKKSHPKAEAVHGYSDWVLRHQDSFSAYAETIESFFNSADLVVSHNAEFDFGFYKREMELAARLPIAKPTFCTMNTYRQRGSLDAVCQRIGAARNGDLHGALEDAWLAMRVYLWLNQRGFSDELPIEFRSGPSNFKAAPPLPVGPLPRRRRKVKEVAAINAEAMPAPASVASP
jgi:DNA polymerase-3 subunit epsilon